MGSENEAKGNRRKKEKKHKKPKKGNTELVLNDGTLNKKEKEHANGKLLEEKKRKRKKGINVKAEKAIHVDGEEGKSIKAAEEKKEKKLRKKKRKGEEKNDDGKYELGGAKADDSLEEKNCGPREAGVGMERSTGKSKGEKKKKKKDRDTIKKCDLLLKEKEDTDHSDVYHISSGDEDCSVGMTKWITEYHQSRPGLKVLQQRIDDFITAHEARLEQERKEREAQAAEGGWTVVVHHKGRKKTTDSESGITVGSVAQAAVEESITKKKHKEVVGLNFYRFKKREDRRNEILNLQSKFEQDKKRIQQLRAARKFRPY